ncbi:FKBP-type peptidyl-prolyl cis-trans isomerase [Sphingomonas fuzhouensis]|uniref:FKBP-type peptidyl-prolyl cis-trans isomerase n=1 Tax=Sphingomonas fuzhouensis TaxID=3106033 RepID=UPI002AFE90FC|nr:FKBP-type peptidyl-prolyl cis-trans isomerase [Sphingomonas sp. SGZ-02]
MKPCSNAPRRLPVAILLSVAMAGTCAPLTAQVGKTAKAPAPKAAPDGGIIPLPLTPIVPPSQRSCAMQTPSGLGYTVLRAGNGPKPGADATVLVNYIGYLKATGAVFDQAMRTPMPVDGVIPGFSEGLQLVGRGGIVRLCVPPALGYGAEASGPIPANADLIFQVELLDFKTAAEIDALRKAGDAAPTPPTTPKP